VGYDDAAFDQSIFGAPAPETGIRPVIARQGDSLGVNPWTVAMNVQYDFVAWGRSGYARADDQFASRQTAPTSAEDPGNETYDPGLLNLCGPHIPAAHDRHHPHLEALVRRFAGLVS